MMKPSPALLPEPHKTLTFPGEDELLQQNIYTGLRRATHQFDAWDTLFLDGYTIEFTNLLRQID